MLEFIFPSRRRKMGGVLLQQAALRRYLLSIFSVFFLALTFS